MFFMRKRFLGRRYQTHAVFAIITMILSAALLTRIMVLIEPMASDIFYFIAQRGKNLVLWLNYLPILLAMLFVYLLTANAAFSVSLVSFFLLVMFMTNRIKILLRGDPFMHWDLTLVKEAMRVAFGYGVWSIVLGIGALIVFGGIATFLCWKCKATRIGWKTRIFGGALMFGFLFFCNEGLYGNVALYNSLPVYGDYYNLADVFNSRGFLYSFIFMANSSGNADTLPKDEKRVAKAVADHEAADIQAMQSSYRPNIVMIMGESFSDISQSDAFNFTGFRNPLETYVQMCQEGISGRLVAPSRGGGTADTEFDVLTGSASRFLRDAPYAYRFLVRPTESLASVLAQVGYESIALHPGYRWFYNRQNVYRNIGFSKAVFEDAFPEDAYLDLYIGEEATFDMLLALLTSHFAEAPDTPLFTFCLTIQNHAGYENRFLPKDTYNFNANIPLTDQERNILSNYFAGMTDADEQLARLKEFLNEQAEPFVLVYFGDHLPSLDQALYDALIPGADAPKGSFERETRLYSVPFMIWQNDAAEAYRPLSEQGSVPHLPDNNTISSNYLGGYLLELLGFEGLSPFFDYTNLLRGTFPVLLENQSFMENGMDDKETPQSAQNMLYLYKAWIRHQIGK